MRLYKIIVWISSALLVAMCLTIIFIDYNFFVNAISNSFNKPGISEAIKTKFFTRQKFSVIKKVCFIVLLLCPLVLYFLLKYKKKIVSLITQAGSAIAFSLSAAKNVFKQNSKSENIIFVTVLSLIFIRSLYYIITYDLQYDEMWSYNYFTAQPFYFSIFSYNNYPLYELSTQLFKWLPFEMKINIRLPVLLMGLASCTVLYVCLKKYFQSNIIAISGMLFFACMPVTTFYMLYARGVIFEILFAVISLFSMLFFIRQPANKNYLILYGLSNALGMYSMPTHIYFWLLTFIISFVFLKNRSKMLRTFLLCNLFILFFSALVYLPVFLGSGFSFVTNAMVEAHDFVGLRGAILYYNSLANFFTGFDTGFYLLLLTGCFLLFKKQKTQDVFLLILVLILLLSTIIIFLMQRIALPARALAFVGLSIPLLLCLIIYHYEKAINNYFLKALIVIIAAFEIIVSNNHPFLHWSRKSDKEAVELANLFMHINIKTSYDNSSNSGFAYFYPALEYYYRINHKSFSLNLAAKNSMRYKPLNPDEYDCIIYSLQDAVKAPQNFIELYKNSEENFVLMKRN